MRVAKTRSSVKATKSLISAGARRPRRNGSASPGEAIRADILHCELRPGARLIFRELQQRYQVGLSPLREALMQLVSERLVILEVNKGFRVAPMRREELLDLINTQIELETIAIRKAMELGDLRWEGNIMGSLHEVSSVPVSESNGALSMAWEARNQAFHEALYAACGSPMLIAFLQKIWDHFSRYIRLWARFPERDRDIAREHAEIARAVVGRDGNRAAALLQEHRMATARSVLVHWPEAGAPSPVTAPSAARGRTVQLQLAARASAKRTIRTIRPRVKK